MFSTMRHHWLLLGACGWVLLILMFASKFINFRAADNYGEKTDARSWTESGARRGAMRPEAGDELDTRPDRPDPKPSYVSPPTAAPPTPSDWQWVTERRMELLSAVCRRHNATLGNLTHVSVGRFVLDRIFVSDKHKILFCQTPKVGNTQWKKVLIVLNGDYSTVEEIPENLVHDHDKNGLPRLSSFSPQDVTERLHTYFKFFIVRDPFERLISAFKDKFVKNPRFEPWYKHDIAPSIIRKYRKVHRDLASSPGVDGGSGPGPGATGLRFEDFVRYLGDGGEGRRRMDRQFGEHVIHWLTYAELCAPCEIRYSVVGHHETLERDAPHILREAGIEGLVSYPHIPLGITRYNRTKVERYFSGISRRDVRRLYARYQGDFNLFGYPSPDFLLD